MTHLQMRLFFAPCKMHHSPLAGLPKLQSRHRPYPSFPVSIRMALLSPLSLFRSITTLGCSTKRDPLCCWTSVQMGQSFLRSYFSTELILPHCRDKTLNIRTAMIFSDHMASVWWDFVGHNQKRTPISAKALPESSSAWAALWLSHNTTALPCMGIPTAPVCNMT